MCLLLPQVDARESEVGVINIPAAMISALIPILKLKEISGQKPGPLIIDFLFRQATRIPLRAA